MSIKDSVTAIEQKYNADVVVYFGALERPHDRTIIKQCHGRRLRKNCLFYLQTYGGDAHAAYRIARCLQMRYGIEETDPEKKGELLIFVDGVCKSAGTILALGCTKILLSEHSELGPIDAQMRKPDEVGERTSGLTPIQAMGVLENQSHSSFKRHFKDLRFKEDLSFSTKMAADIATNLTIGLMSKLYEQVDPIRLAEVERSLRIAAEYGRRIGKKLKSGALESLLSGYPSHSFVIDRKEAREIFQHVEDVPVELTNLADELKVVARYATEADNDPFLGYLSEEPALPVATQQPQQAEGGQP